MKESYLKEKFKEYIVSQGYRIEKEIETPPPDMILTKEDKIIAVEIKGFRNSSNFSSALGELLFARFNYKEVSEMWLVIGKTPSRASKKWLECLWSNGIKIYTTINNKFEILTPEKFLKISERAKRSFEEIEESILALLKENPGGISIEAIAKSLNLEKQQTIDHLTGRLSRSMFKGKVVFEGETVKLKNYTL